ncbi:MAG: M67 family metallopeptidase [Clostridiales bacterium]|jgi:proteasome lid subunit RPN8/RPN11|nr:M67 family metallopeptidase [Clostridiales bacterium]MDR2752602.1 M67 family metallopeptidase [Clostridiales bacterium]
MIALSKEDLEKIRRHAEAEYPYECCGLLLGKASVNSHEVHEAEPVPNTFEDGQRKRRFEISPDEFFRAEMKARRSGKELLGFYHSHPDCPEDASEYDRLHALPVYSYLIVSVEKGVSAGIKSWVLKSDRSVFEQEEVREI